MYSSGTGRKLGCALYKKTLSRFAEILIPRKKLAVPYIKKTPGLAQPSPAQPGPAEPMGLLDWLSQAAPGRNRGGLCPIKENSAVPYIKKLLG